MIWIAQHVTILLLFQSGKVYLQRCNSSNSSSSTTENKSQTSTKSITKFQDLNFPPSSKKTLNLFDEDVLDLKLVSLSSSSPSSSPYQSVCTLDKVKSALERAEKETVRKRSISMTSKSSSLSSSSNKDGGDVEQDERSTASFAAGCPNCLMYVLISRGRPRCPRCNSNVPLPAPVKKPRIDLNISIWIENTTLRLSHRFVVLIFCKE